MEHGHVNWKKIKGKPNASMSEKDGWGYFGCMPEVGKRMFISGDYGVTTSTVVSVEEKDDVLTVVTKNSIYEVRKDRR